MERFWSGGSYQGALISTYDQPCVPAEAGTQSGIELRCGAPAFAGARQGGRDQGRLVSGAVKLFLQPQLLLFQLRDAHAVGKRTTQFESYPCLDRIMLGLKSRNVAVFHDILLVECVGRPIKS